MFTTEELKNILVLIKAGAKSLDLDGNGLIVSGVIIRKIEDLIKKETVIENKEVLDTYEAKVGDEKGTAVVN